ncbi:MAG TPA: hypothetical protein VGZ48_06170 [Candidatus Acidoferrales bacterium]|jgi:hypothetical protein|nr:hypothetical protein [Candidatus Acidoferrales bacterium]
MSVRTRNGILGSGLSVFVACAAILAITVLSGLHFAAKADDDASKVVMYNSIPKPLPANVSSEGPEAYAYSQIGDGVMLAGPDGRTLDKVSVVLSSWGCQSGNWYTGETCTTTPGATYNLPITVNIYSVNTNGTSLEGATPEPAPGTLLATLTENFDVPYRPSADAVNCNSGQWYDQKDQTCFNGFASTITFDLSSQKVKLPKLVIVGFQFNSTDYGPNPIGTTSCNATSEGCFYDSLNISTDSNEGNYKAIGAVLDVDGIFINYSAPGAAACSTPFAEHTFGLDAGPGCWTGYHPEIQVTATKKDGEKDVKHGHQP